VASANAFCGQPAAFDRPMFLKRFEGIGRTGWLIPAVEANPGAEDQPVGAHGQGDDMGQWVHWV